MYPVSQSYKAAVALPYRTDKLVGTILTKDGITYAIGNDDLVTGSLSINERCCSSSDIDVGTAYASELSVELMINVDNPYSLDGGFITLQYGLLTGAEAWEYVELGQYYITDIERQRAVIRITAIDNIIKLDREYSGGTISGALPLTIVAGICSRCGLALATSDLSDLANSSIYITVDDISEIGTERDLLQYVCQLLGCFARCTRSGSLELCCLHSSPDYIIDADRRYSGSLSDYEINISKVSYGDISAGTGDCELSLSSNPLIEGRSDIEAICGDILAQIGNVTYCPGSVKWYGDPSLQAGDNIGFCIGDTSHSIIAMNVTYKYRAASSIDSYGKSGTLRAEYNPLKRLSQTVRKINKEIIEVDRQAQLLNNAIGGNVLIRQDSEETNEILIMDSADPEQAVKVWRWNMGGLGYSDNCTGADNPDRTYNVAITMDGVISADFITAGTLKGVMIIADSGSIGGWTIQANGIMSADGGVLLDGTGGIIETKSGSELTEFSAGQIKMYSINERGSETLEGRIYTDSKYNGGPCISAAGARPINMSTGGFNRLKIQDADDPMNLSDKPRVIAIPYAKDDVTDDNNGTMLYADCVQTGYIAQRSPFRVKNIDFFNNGFVVTAGQGSLSNTSSDFTNTFITTTDAAGRITSVYNRDTELRTDITYSNIDL